MQAVAVTSKDHVGVIDVPAPADDGLALVGVERSGVCGTDLKIIHGDIPVAFPRVLGHEIIGRVIRPGAAGVVPAGTRVLVDPSASCGRCRTCRRDRQHLCPRGTLMGRDVDGGLAERVAVEESRIFPIPDSIEDAGAGLLQVLGTCIHAQDRIAASPDRTAAVIGLGVSGLLHLQLLRQRGVHRIVGITRSEQKRELAYDLGATLAVHPDDAQAAVDDLTDGEGADIVVEAAGLAVTLRQALELAGLGAQILMFGITSRADDLPLYQAYFRELELISARAARAGDYVRGIELAAADRLELTPLVTGTYPLEHVDRAFERLDRPDALKVTLEMR